MILFLLAGVLLVQLSLQCEMFGYMTRHVVNRMRISLLFRFYLHLLRFALLCRSAPIDWDKFDNSLFYVIHNYVNSNIGHHFINLYFWI